MAKKLESNFINMVVVLFCISLIASAGVGYMYTLTEKPIAKAAQQKQQEAIRSVMPGKFDNDPAQEKWSKEVDGKTLEFYPAKSYTKEIQNSSLDEKILFLVSLETRQNRYRTQVVPPLVPKEQSEQIKERLRTRLRPDEHAQVECQIDFSDREHGEIQFSAKGFADVVKDDVVYELKFVSELTHEHFLQCASYMAAMDLPRGILWNTRDNTSYEIGMPDQKAFLDALTRAVTKGILEKYYEPAGNLPEAYPFAVIDTETNWNDKVMSIGVIVADSKTKKKMDSVYYIITPEYKAGGRAASATEAGHSEAWHEDVMGINK